MTTASYAAIASSSLANTKVGKAAQVAAVEAMKDQLLSLDIACRQTEVLDNQLRKVAAALVSFSEGRPLGVSCLMRRPKEQVRRSEIVAHIAAIDAAGDGGLRFRLEAQRDLHRIKKTERSAVLNRNEEARKDIAIAERFIGASESSDGSNLARRLARRLYTNERRLYTYRVGRASISQASRAPVRCLASGAGRSADAAWRTHIARSPRRRMSWRSLLKESLTRQELDLRRLLRDYFNDPAFGMSAQVGPESNLLGERYDPGSKMLVADLEGNEIRRHEDRAREAAERIRVLVPW